MACEYRHRRRVEFADTDMAGIAHFACFFRYAEEAEHAFLRSLGLSVHAPAEGVTVGFPRAAARCEYLLPARFEDEVEVHIWVHKKRTRSLVYQFEVRLGDDSIAHGELAVTCCRSYRDGTLEAVPLPPPFVDKLEEAPYAALAFR